ncbi:MAG TPA: tRNA pseudouridine(55) synthase TruB [Bryobacteraceae bacterium]|nr:tRNA pseudouridine(55) synthase TruB [Bryobacteraceae bacterium]
MDGVVVIDKPEGWTSHDVVAKARGILKTKHIGHLGTLDPIATGVLPLIVDRATRLARFYTRSDKIYEGVVRCGWSTDTYDRAGEPAGKKTEVTLDPAEVDRQLDRFRGAFWQTPPPVSAKNVGGRRAYDLAREGNPVALEPVHVEVFELAVLGIEGPDIRLRVHCSGGTYVRSIAHEFGAALGCGAHLQALRRTASGEFDLSQAIPLPRLQEMAAEGRLAEACVPAARMLADFPCVPVDDATATLIRHGRNFPASPFRAQPGARHVKAVTRDGVLVAIGEAVLPNLYHPVVVL